MVSVSMPGLGYLRLYFDRFELEPICRFTSWLNYYREEFPSDEKYVKVNLDLQLQGEF